MTSSIHTLSIIIPAYNEESTIAEVLDTVVQVNLGNIRKEIIVVNDHSSDQTGEVVQQYIEKNSSVSIKLMNHDKNLQLYIQVLTRPAAIV